ncbi:gtpase-activating protein and vps9 domain-containing protein [Anaeramoeba ignava]|uniref:Gtpase-activating protein and vps9 domain-containing protein n=1 Tax=Anaeramoeba ignava TaxID=1746090 RepID=A0A9Q0REQ5_ANAIG|nr:gtpase-activating protein and vps9 domain-containing protein [Anaeramoeba ignava]
MLKGDELIKLQESLKKEQFCTKAEQDSLDKIRQKAQELAFQLQSDIAECTNMNRFMESLTPRNISSFLLSPENSHPWKVKLYDPLESPFSTVQKNRYQQMLRLLRSNIPVLIEAISFPSVLSLECTEILSHSAIFSVFGNLINDEEEDQFLLLIQGSMEKQLQTLPDPKKLLSENKLLNRIISAFSKSSSCYNYLFSSLRQPLMSVIQDTLFDDLTSQNFQEKDKEGEISGKLISYASEILRSLEAKLSLMPYGIRWICKSIKNFCIKYKKKSSIIKSIADFFFVRVITPAVVSPGLTQIAKILMSMCYGTTSLRTSNISEKKLQSLTTDISKFFELVVNISDRMNDESEEKYEGISKQEYEFLVNMKPHARSTLISPNDLFSLHNLLDEYLSYLLSNDPDNPITKNALMELIVKMGKPPAFLPESRNKYLSISLSYSLPTLPKLKEKEQIQEKKSHSVVLDTLEQIDEFGTAFQSQDEELMKDAEKKLRQTLCNLDFFDSEKYKGKNFTEILKSEKEIAYASRSLLVACQLDSSLRMLEQMPSIFKNTEYRPLIWKMKKEFNNRQENLKQLLRSKHEYQLVINQLEELLKQTQFRKELFNNFIISLVANFFIDAHDLELEAMRQLILQANTVEELEKGVIHFFENTQILIKTHQITSSFSNSHLTSILSIIENYGFISIYNDLFCPEFIRSKSQFQDEQFHLAIEKLKKLNPIQILGISKDLSKPSIWSFPLEELSALNLYKSPLLKIACLSKCTETVDIILNFNSFTDDNQLRITILVYVIILSNPQNLPSNISFIEMFVDREIIDPKQEYWFTIFKTAFAYLQTLSNEENSKKVRFSQTEIK